MSTEEIEMMILVPLLVLSLIAYAAIAVAMTKLFVDTIKEELQRRRDKKQKGTKHGKMSRRSKIE